MVKNPLANAGEARDAGLIPGSERIPKLPERKNEPGTKGTDGRTAPNF